MKKIYKNLCRVTNESEKRCLYLDTSEENTLSRFKEEILKTKFLSRPLIFGNVSVATHSEANVFIFKKDVLQTNGIN